MDMMPPFPYRGRGRRDMLSHRALAAGRVMGYQEAMRDMQGAERVAGFVQSERARGPPEAPKPPLLRVRLERERPRIESARSESRSGSKTTSSSGTVVTGDAYQQYRRHKAKHEELSRLLAAGPGRKQEEEREKREKERKKERASKQSRATTNTGSWVSSGYPPTTSTSSSDSTHRHHGHHGHHHRHHDDTEDLRLIHRRMQGRHSLDSSMWAQPGTPRNTLHPHPDFAPQHMPQQHEIFGDREHFDRDDFDAFQRQQAGFGGGPPRLVREMMPGFVRGPVREDFSEVPTEMLLSHSRFERAPHRMWREREV
ncbi:hypothetical protein LTR36_004789 [Oleoguttula mirabilis]|uniref:Uncharacterized protein n=1 Tax=Oleoguttula mirabilis TaxID=1507867 RepID=A0AAV9JFD1_9PEZI|nr:hypothetical protein LTR36_004789 [Oleoguttula mirabilis]